ncbi:thioesterase [Enterococcus florum]|uniref:Thioesterase n=1 Tax=Enterococcus florum TaxID=2480627 RepID=A0A4P5P548_9ENTE|nr:thioesterase family protein [Enterococcus florum]GCF92800.1 thioesterase [Enterococcus florum]
MTKYTMTFSVTSNDTAKKLGSGDLDVLGTPRLVAMMEHCAKDLLRKQLKEEETSVGYKLDLKHLAPTTVGSELTINAELVEQSGNRAFFVLEAYEQDVLVGKAKHERVVVDSAKFLAKLNQNHNM